MLMTNNKKILYLVGQNNINKKPLIPFNKTVCEFLNDLSKKLSTDKKILNYTDVKAFSFWCRKANIEKYKKQFEDGKFRLGLGLAFHITPSNIPTNFAYSFTFGLLAGNANIVRIPTNNYPQVDIICNAIKSLFNKKKYQQIKKMNALVKYEKNDEITAKFSAICDARIIWGGDTTIKEVRKFPMPETSIEINFADKYSFCVLDSISLKNLKKKNLSELADRFFNDTYLLDQNACSSPHLVVWIGNKNEKIKKLFWNEVYATVKKKYKLAPINIVKKYNNLLKDVIESNNIKSVKRYGNDLYRIKVKKIKSDIEKKRGIFGTFYEYDCKNIDDIANIVSSKFQTLTYFGIEKLKILNFVINNRLSGIDRIVPVGRALDIDVIWDGFDIEKNLSRIIDVK